MKLTELAAMLGGSAVNLTDDFEVTGISTLDEAQPGEISFITDKKFLPALPGSKASAVLISAKLAPVNQPHIPLADVWSGTLASLKLFYPNFARRTYDGVHPSAIIDNTAAIGSDVTISPLAVVGPGAVIGDGTYLGPGVVIGERCRVGQDCTIYANVVLESETVLGNGVFMQPGAVIGADGFKYEMLAGKWTKIPQVGHVELADDVEIGANTCIDRASYTVTSVGNNSKIDNLVQIAHNVKVGKNTVVVSQSGIAGSTTVGDYTILAAQVGIADNLSVGNKAVILAQSGVKDQVKDGETWFGTPARPFRQEARIIAQEGKLPEMAAELQRLSKKIAELEDEIGKLKTQG